jgi:transcriptional regulator with XRE-family HTH domain
LTNLKKLRIASGLSQQTLAENFNLSQQSIYKYENGLAEPDINSLKKFACYFGVSVDYLIGYTDSDFPKDANTFPITSAEITVIQKLRQLKPDVRQAITNLIDRL